MGAQRHVDAKQHPVFRDLVGVSTGGARTVKTGREGSNGLRDDVGGYPSQPAGLGTWAFSCRLWEPRSVPHRVVAAAVPGWLKQGTA